VLNTCYSVFTTATTHNVSIAVKFEKLKEPFQLMKDGCAIKCAHPTLPVLAGVSINQVFLFDETDGTRHISTFSTWGKYDDEDEDDDYYFNNNNNNDEDEDQDEDYYFNNNDEDDDEEDQPTHRERSNEITAEITQLGWNVTKIVSLLQSSCDAIASQTFSRCHMFILC